MTALEFVSHFHHSHWINVRNIDDNSAVNCKIYEFEREEYSEWHELKVVDWFTANTGKTYLEVADV